MDTKISHPLTKNYEFTKSPFEGKLLQVKKNRPTYLGDTITLWGNKTLVIGIGVIEQDQIMLCLTKLAKYKWARNVYLQEVFVNNKIGFVDMKDVEPCQEQQEKESKEKAASWNWDIIKNRLVEKEKD